MEREDLKRTAIEILEEEGGLEERSGGGESSLPCGADDRSTVGKAKTLPRRLGMISLEDCLWTVELAFGRW